MVTLLAAFEWFLSDAMATPILDGHDDRYRAKIAPTDLLAYVRDRRRLTGEW